MDFFKRHISWFAASATAALLAGGYFFAIAPPPTFPAGNIIVIARGASVSDIAEELSDAHIIAHPDLLRFVLRISGTGGSVQAGAYRFQAPQNLFTVAARLITGAYGLPPVRLTFPEGMTVREMASKIADAFPEVKAEDLQSVMRDYGDAGDFRVLNLGGGECAGVSQALIGANFFEAAHEREYRNALVFQRKYDEAAQCNEAILRLIGSGLAQLLGGVRLDDLVKLGTQLAQMVPGEIAQGFARAATALAKSGEFSNEELTPISAAVDAWTVKVAAFAMEQDGQLDLTEAADGLLV